MPGDVKRDQNHRPRSARRPRYGLGANHAISQQGYLGPHDIKLSPAPFSIGWSWVAGAGWQPPSGTNRGLRFAQFPDCKQQTIASGFPAEGLSPSP